VITEKIRAESIVKCNYELLDNVLQECGLNPILKNEYFNLTPGFNEEFWLGIEIEKFDSINIWFLIQSYISIGLDRSSEMVLLDTEELQSKKIKALLENFLKSHVEIVYYGGEKLKEIYFFDNDHNLVDKYSQSTLLLPRFLIKKLYKSHKKYFKPIIPS